MCLAEGHNAVTLVRLKPAAPQSGAKHSTTEPLRSLYCMLNIRFRHDRHMSVLDLSVDITVKISDIRVLYSIIVVQHDLVYLFDLILYKLSANRDGSSWVEPVLKAKINVSCSRSTMQ